MRCQVLIFTWLHWPKGTFQMVASILIYKGVGHGLSVALGNFLTLGLSAMHPIPHGVGHTYVQMHMGCLLPWEIF